ncbi:YciI family protein [Rathayibacter soli]|uniref:YciI family protein n=1 Tax=Rathayibacter soli TaxID=3144168 RepID=UPI0027E4ED49|nr:YciI family protein [Glaciibacter superstes]
MKYMLLIYGTEAAWAAMTRPAFEALMAKHAALQQELRASGEFIDTNELVTENSKVVRTSHRAVEVTDGPFVEVEEVLAGYYLVECDSIERATAIAATLGEAEFGLVEVRATTREPDH